MSKNYVLTFYNTPNYYYFLFVASSGSIAVDTTSLSKTKTHSRSRSTSQKPSNQKSDTKSNDQLGDRLAAIFPLVRMLQVHVRLLVDLEYPAKHYFLLLSLPNNIWRLIVFAPFLLIIIIKSPKQRLETYCFCSVSYYYSSSCSCSCYSPFFPCTMNLSTADLRNYRTEFHEIWWSYRYMFLVDPKVFRFVVKGVKAIFLGVQRGWGLL